MRTHTSLECDIWQKSSKPSYYIDSFLHRLNRKAHMSETHMGIHTDENPSTSHKGPNFADNVATLSGDIQIENVEDDFDFFLEDNETEELIIKEELEEEVYTSQEIMKNEADDEENEDFLEALEENKECLNTEAKEELLVIKEDPETEIEEKKRTAEEMFSDTTCPKCNENYRDKYALQIHYMDNHT